MNLLDKTFTIPHASLIYVPDAMRFQRASAAGNVKTRVTSCKLRVPFHELRVQIHELRVQIHELQVQIHEVGD